MLRRLLRDLGAVAVVAGAHDQRVIADRKF
jgi:hypothetical protein